MRHNDPGIQPQASLEQQQQQQHRKNRQANIFRLSYFKTLLDQGRRGVRQTFPETKASCAMCMVNLLAWFSCFVTVYLPLQERVGFQ